MPWNANSNLKSNFEKFKRYDFYSCLTKEFVQVILFEIDCAIFYTNLYELFCQFISWTNWVNSGKFMDKCWISCQVMADMKKVYDDLIIILTCNWTVVNLSYVTHLKPELHQKKIGQQVFFHPLYSQGVNPGGWKSKRIFRNLGLAEKYVNDNTTWTPINRHFSLMVL